jgi:hypothetical protein
MAYLVKNVSYSGKGKLRTVVMVNHGKLLDFVHGDWKVSSVDDPCFHGAKDKVIEYNSRKVVVTADGDPKKGSIRMNFHQASGYFVKADDAYVDIDCNRGDTVTLEL